MNKKSLGGRHVGNPNCIDYNNLWIQGSCGQAAGRMTCHARS
jgi:hypothetical protein